MCNNQKYRIFVVDDNMLFLKVMQKHLSENSQYEVSIMSSGSDCLNRLNQKPNIISLDYTLPDFNGKEVLEVIRKESPETQVIIVSGQKDITTAIELLKIGAYDYIVKGTDTREKISISIEKIIERIELTKENQRLKQAIKSEYNFSALIKGNSKSIENVFKLMEKATQTNINISVFGETGTGKELVAKGIHYNSKRSAQPFVPVNISSIPDTLIESELFGYDKGAFTGAENNKPGKIEQANGGTLFLDEIGEMNLSTQAKLLRVLQERELSRLGSNKTITFDVRIITATHRNLKELIKTGEFREDLYYRLLGLTIDLPPLRERGNDILVLAKHFINLFCDENNLPRKQLSEGARERLKSYHFPGNIRELKALTDLACVLSDSTSIESEHININTSAMSMNFLNQEKTLQEYSKEIVEYYLGKYKNTSLVAQKLGIGRSTIYRYVQSNV
jgi:two-component system, NtrC family, response regulator AtoC